MSTTNANWRWTYQPNGISTNFPFNNLALAASDLTVRRWSVHGNVLSLPAYTVTGIGDPNGGAVVFESAPPAEVGSILEIVRSTGRLQGATFRDFVQETASVREQRADRAMLGLQEAMGLYERTLRVSPLDPAGQTLPPRTEMLESFLYMGPDGVFRGVPGVASPPVLPRPLAVLPAVTNIEALMDRPSWLMPLGHAAPGDLGSRAFGWVSGDATPADGVMTVQPLTGEAGRYKVLDNTLFTPRWCGAKGDGVTDDAVPLQKFFDICGEGVRGIVPVGTFLTSATIMLGVLTATLAVDGCGWGSIIKATDGSNLSAVIEVGGNANVTKAELRNFCIDGNRANNPEGGLGLSVIRGYKFNLTHLRVTECTSHGIQYGGSSPNFENYIVDCNPYANGGWGIYMVGPITDTHVIGGDIGYNVLGGVRIATSCSIRDAVIWGAGLSTSRGVVSAGSSWQLFNVTIEGHGLQGIVVGDNDKNWKIIGNKIYANSWSASTDGLYDGIYVGTGASGGAIIGNFVYSALSDSQPYSMRYAVHFAGAHGPCSIFANDFTWLVAGATNAQKTSGAIVNGILPTDKSDFNWIRTNLWLRLSAGISPAGTGAFIVCPFNTEDGDWPDVNGEYDNTAYTFTPKNTGPYEFEFVMAMTPNAAANIMGAALYTAAGTELIRIDYRLAQSAALQGISGTKKHWLIKDTAYEIRHIHSSTSTTISAGKPYTNCRIRPLAN